MGRRTVGDVWGMMTVKQRLYIIIMQLLGAMLLDFGLNLLFSYLKYKSNISNGDIIPVWGWPNLVAGHVAVETIVQSVLTWVIAGALVRGDVRRGKVEKLSVKIDWLSKYLQTQDFLTTDQSFQEFFRKIFFGLVDGFKFAGFCLVTFAIPTIIVITIVSYAGNVDFTAWGTVWFTAAYGAALGVTTPLPALAAMSHGAGNDNSESGGPDPEAPEAVDIH
eukprot:TRINITY_DN848_c0_g1_i1.p1 TRINITY_DN848_c0_g1~~TRINITY_DN848_c0_g1_i1.p1  ORF type:complete len:220 (+),score=59.56 TRINITY_DN848_c0_g1_i1:128-787(+)